MIACSALKRAYRDRIRRVAGDVTFIHLTGPRDVIADRMAARKGHFMPVSLLDSQLATLEPPTFGEHSIAADITGDPSQIMARLLDRLRRPKREE